MNKLPKLIPNMLYFRNVFFASIVITILLATSPAPVFAAGELEEIVVTARYRSEDIQETPLAITAITAEDLSVRGFTTSYEVAYTVPNASFRPAQAAFGNTMTAFIRGIGQNDFNFAFEPGVGIYIDDVYHPFTLASQTDLLDLERVEILRGPQGTLFGRGAIGGAIRYVSKKPQGDNTGSIQITGGDYKRVDLRGSYDFAISENVFARVAGVSKSRDGYQDVIDFACARPAEAGPLQAKSVNIGNNCKLGTQGGEDIVGVRGSLRWVAASNLDFIVTADYQNDTSEARADTLLYVNPVWPSFVTGLPYDSRFIPPNPFVTYATYDDPNSSVEVNNHPYTDKWTLSGRGEWEINSDLTATAILSYTDIYSTLATDADGSPLNMQVVDGVSDINFITAELRFNGRLWDKMDWTIGGFFYDGKADNWQMVSIPFLSLILDGVPPTVGNMPFVNANNLHTNRNESGFGHVVYDFNGRMTFNGGIRFSHDVKTVDFDNTRVVRPGVVVEDDHIDWKAGIDYKWTDDLLTYFTASTGYRPGSYNPRPFQATQVVSVDQEESTTFELGVKSEWLENRLRLNLAGFYTDWSTRILGVNGTECPLISLGPPPVYVTVPAGTPGSALDTVGNNCLLPHISRTFYENGPGEIYGVEVEGTWQVSDGLTINGSFGLTKWSSADINDNPNVLSDRPVYVPETNWSFAASYEIPINNGSRFTPRIDVYGQSEICTSTITVTSVFPGAGCSKGYELVNARVDWRSPDDSWMVAVGVSNLTDRMYYLNRFDLSAFGQPTVEGQPGRPSEWYVTVRRDF